MLYGEENTLTDMVVTAQDLSEDIATIFPKTSPSQPPPSLPPPTFASLDTEGTTTTIDITDIIGTTDTIATTVTGTLDTIDITDTTTEDERSSVGSPPSAPADKYLVCYLAYA